MVLPFHSKQPNPSNHSSYFILYCFRHNLRRTQAYKQKLSNDIVESHFQYVEWDRRQDDKSIQVFDRRYSMGEIGGRLADLSIITADNSRFEKVEDILADIKVGLAKTDGKYVEIPDRREAIEYSLSHAEDGDIIAIIGKGHEDYQEIEGVRYHFLDREVVQETVKKLHM